MTDSAAEGRCCVATGWAGGGCVKVESDCDGPLASVVGLRREWQDVLKRIVDLTSCDSEPIHIIGAVQPSGALIAADAETARVEFASANVADYLGRPLEMVLGSPLSEVLGANAFAAVMARDLAPSQPDLLKPHFFSLKWPDGTGLDLECYPHLHDGRIVLEFVHRERGPAAMWEEDLLRQRIISDLIRPDTLTDLAKVGAEILREVTGFDRVMIYRFAPDRHGEVIAESTSRADSFHGLHYPASDIPDPARRHFALNVIRSIPDIHASPTPILARADSAAAGSGRPLDLTFSKLRAVAPVHIEYLGNMGVGASMSISLISNHELWGLVACHHYGPLHLSWSRLRFCELLGGTLSALLQSLENTIQLRHSIRAEKIAFGIEREVRLGKPLHQTILDHADILKEECSAQGMLLKLGTQTFACGSVPAADWDPAILKATLVEGIATCDRAELLSASDPALLQEVAGAALLELSEDGEDWLILFRNEFEHAIRWAGKPDKQESLRGDGTVRLSPRGSFALWREERRGRSRPFTEIDDEILRITRRALFAMNSLDRERAAVTAKAAAEAEEMRLRLALLDAARSRSLGELASALAHELNQPLAAVTNYVNACRQELRNHAIVLPDPVGRLMDCAVLESSRAADLVRRLRSLIGDGQISLEEADLHAVLRQGVDLALAATANAPVKVRFEFDHQVPVLWIDPVQIAQVVLNLVRNSLTAMREIDGGGILTIATRLDGSWVEVAVNDTGPGIAKPLERTLFEPFHSSTTRGMGIGLSLCRSIVEAHGGRISTRPMAAGTQFVFTLSLGDGRDD